MEKIKIELTDKEFNVLSELLAAVTTNSYRKAVGDKIVIEASISFSKETDKVLKRLDKKINS